MTGWLIGAGLGALGIGGGVAAIMTGILPLGGLLAVFSGLSLGKVLDFIKSPVGIVLMVVMLCFGSFAYGSIRSTRIERAACQARIDASIEAAREFDAQIAAEQRAAAQKQITEATARVTAAEQKVDEYARTHKSCSIGDDGAAFLGSFGGVSDGGVQPEHPLPPRRR